MLEGFEGGGDAVLAVAGADDDGDAGFCREGRGVVPGLLDGGESGFGEVLPIEEAEVPVGDDCPGIEPAVGPGVDGEAGDAFLDGGADGPIEGVGLGGGGVAAGIESEFGDQDRAVAGEVVEAAEVGAEGLRLFEVEVEGGEVRVFGFEEFGGGVIGVAPEEVGVEGFSFLDEFFECLAGFPGGHPADEVGGDFVADEDGGEGRGAFGMEEAVGELDPCLGEG